MNKNLNINYIHFDTVDSTNTWAKKNIDSLDPSQLTCVTALEQTAGRGRLGKRWASPKGQNLYATLCFCLPKDTRCLQNLGQILSLSCASVLKSRGFDPQIKWPNDLLLSGKKVAGVLTETLSQKNHIAVILGIGINLNMTQELLDTIDQPATSLAQLSGQTWTVEQVLGPLLTQFLQDLKLLQKEGFFPFKTPYEEILAFRGETITCKDGNSVVKGICHGVDFEGKLDLLLPSGKMLKLTAGDLM